VGDKRLGEGIAGQMGTLNMLFPLDKDAGDFIIQAFFWADSFQADSSLTEEVQSGHGAESALWKGRIGEGVGQAVPPSEVSPPDAGAFSVQQGKGG